MATPGVLKWANDIRFAMTNDPARQKFKDEVEYRGFDYLRDLDAQINSILASPAEDFTFEILKTPSRTRTAPPKAKPTPSRLRNAVSLEEQEGKENAVPLNAFQKALLSAKDKSDRPPSRSTPFSPKSQPTSNIIITDTPEPLSFHRRDEMAISPVKDAAGDPAMDILVEPAYLAVTDLSVIAEDEENDRSRLSTKAHATHAEGQQVSMLAASPVPRLSGGDTHISTEEMESTSSDLPHVSQPQQPSSPAESSLAPAVSSTSVSSTLAPAEDENMEILEDTQSQGLTEPLLEIPPWQPPQAEEKRAPSVPTSTYQDTEEPLIDKESMTDETHELKQKSSIPSFPPPEPMPLRKSMRAPKDGETVSAAPTPASAAAPLKPSKPSKRGSWLARAKQIKALEDPGMDSAGETEYQPTFNPLKRKSAVVQRPSQETPAPSSSEERPRKSLKVHQQDIAPARFSSETPSVSHDLTSAVPAEEPTGVLDQLRSTVARMGNAMGRSLGGAAAAQVLAEARAAAEAKVAERDQLASDPLAMSIERSESAVDMLMDDQEPPTVPSKDSAGEQDQKPIFSVPPDDRRLSLSDLVSSRESQSRLPIQGLVFRPPSPSSSKDNVSSAPVQISPSSRPVFTRPEKVFFPPERSPDHQSDIFKPPAFSRPAAMSVGLSPRLGSPSEHRKASIPSAQSTQETAASDSLFDSQDGVPAWLPSTQDTEYSLIDEQQEKMVVDDLDDDDSWPLENNGPFIPIRTDDTWSTLPSAGQTGDTGPLTMDEPFAAERSRVEDDPEQLAIAAGNTSRTLPGAFTDEDYDGDEDEDDLVPGSDDAVVLNMAKPTVGLVQPKLHERTPSQTSLTSSLATPETQSQLPATNEGGFLNQAQRFMSTVLGSAKKPKPEVKFTLADKSKPEVKSLQLAAAAAKRQQEERDKKEARLREMEARRQAAMQRKAEEEKARAAEEERKVREENERRKKEREELTDKRTLKTSTFKKQEDEASKKRVELQKKASKTNLKVGPPVNAKPSALKPPSKGLNASVSSLSQSTTSKPVEKPYKPTAPIAGPSKLKPKSMPKAPQPTHDDEASQPSQMLHSQMAARAKAQIQAAKGPPALPPTETIELPDIQSEYSDSDDSDREEKKKALPTWTQSPELRRALEEQATINPDDIFGQIRPLKMEEVFKTRTSRFRARTSSANWTGSDRLTEQEELEYVRRMGFK